MCPCSKYGILEASDEDAKCDFLQSTPNSLMDHLKKRGGNYQEKKHREKVWIGLGCEHHYAARVFLKELYKDFNGTENGVCEYKFIL